MWKKQMPNITLSIPEELKKKMDEFKILNWSEVAREAFARRLEQLVILKKLENDFKSSKLTDEDIARLGKIVKESMSEKKKKG